MRRLLTAFFVAALPGAALAAIARDGGASYPITGSANSGTVSSVTAANLSTSTASTLIVCGTAFANSNPTDWGTVSVAWATDNSASCGAFTQVSVNPNPNTNYRASIWTSTCTSTFSSKSVTATPTNGSTNAAGVIVCDALTGASGAGLRIGGSWTATLASSQIVAGVTAGSWIYTVAGNESAASLAPVTNTTELADIANGTGPSIAAVGVNTTGTSGDITVGWSTTSTWGVRAAVEILASGNAGIAVPVSASSDDATQTGASGSETVAALNATTLGASLDAVTEWAGMRFQGITIPKDATITAARLLVAPSATGEDEPSVTVYMEAADDCATFSQTPGTNISGRSRTTGVSWSSTDLAANGSTYHLGPDLTADVQAVVNRASWASGNDMCVIVQGGSTGTRDLTIESYDNTGGNPPRLEIVYATAASGSATLTAASATAAAGLVSSAGTGTSSPTAVAATAAAGTLTGSVSTLLIASTATGTAASLSSAGTGAAALTSVEASAVAASVSSSGGGGSGEATLTGAVATASAEQLTSSGAAVSAATATAATGAAGQLASSGTATAALAAVAATAALGNLASAGAAVAALTGVAAAAAAGSVTGSATGEGQGVVNVVTATAAAELLASSGGAVSALVAVTATASAGALVNVVGTAVATLTEAAAAAVAGVVSSVGTGGSAVANITAVAPGGVCPPSRGGTLREGGTLR